MAGRVVGPGATSRASLSTGAPTSCRASTRLPLDMLPGGCTGLPMQPGPPQPHPAQPQPAQPQPAQPQPAQPPLPGRYPTQFELQRLHDRCVSFFFPSLACLLAMYVTNCPVSCAFRAPGIPTGSPLRWIAPLAARNTFKLYEYVE